MKYLIAKIILFTGNTLMIVPSKISVLVTNL